MQTACIQRKSAVRAMLGVFAAILWTNTSPASANAPACSSPWLIDQTLSNGSRWQMCWERREREGIVFSDIYFNQQGESPRRILAEATVAQIHVPYDDDMARYHDVSDYGLGKDQYMNALTQGDCPGGQLLNDGNRNVVCRQNSIVVNEGILGSGASVDSSLNLFSVSHVGAYNYIPQWTFYDDGTIEPSMGATGRLQRYRDNADHGWSIRPGETNHVGVSHLHNYYWKLDFDLGTDGTDDVFEEINVVTQSDGSRETSYTEYTTEVARKFSPEQFRSWRVRDGGSVGVSGNPSSYEIVSVDTGHSDVGPDYEPWTENDIYVTRVRACERFASHNPADSLGGCDANGSLASFVNGETLAGEDQVVWFGLSFHHIPRDEDEPNMHAHWNKFQIIPRDWNTPDSVAPTHPPTIISEGFEGAHGWTIATASDQRTQSGKWEAQRAHGTWLGNVPMQLAGAPEGNRALVTGVRRGASAYSYDLDGGWTRAVSPIINLPAGTRATLDFKWLFAHDNKATPHDFLIVNVISSASNQRVLFARGRPVTRRGRWIDRSIDISGHLGLPTRIMVRAADRYKENLLEAGFDDMRIRVEY